MKTRRMFGAITLCGLLLGLMSVQSAMAVPILIADVPAYGYNVSPAPDGGAGIIGCGPTTGAMILDTYDNRGATGLIGNPLTDARLLGSSTYMDVNSGGFGAPTKFHFGLEAFALDRGHIVDAVLHIEPTTFNPAGWPDYTVGPDIALDATFWNTTTWDIIDASFLNFLKVEIDANRPVSLTVDSDGDGDNDHWMVGVGYDMDTNMWAGYNTWDSSLHWYDVQSGFIPGNTMGVAFVRTFNYLGPTEPPETPVIPEPSIMLMIGTGLIGLAGYIKRRKS